MQHRIGDAARQIAQQLAQRRDLARILAVDPVQRRGRARDDGEPLLVVGRAVEIEPLERGRDIRGHEMRERPRRTDRVVEVKLDERGIARRGQRVAVRQQVVGGEPRERELDDLRADVDERVAQRNGAEAGDVGDVQ